MAERARTDLDLGSGHHPAGDRRFLPEARPPDPGPEPGHVHRRGRQPPHDGHLAPGAAGRRPASRCSPARWPSGSGSPCSSRTSPRRWRRAAARPRPPRCARPRRRRRRCASATAAARDRARERAARGRHRARRGRPDHPRRRRDHRGRGQRRRVGHHRRVGARHPRGRRRPLGGHRRHARAVGLDRGAHHLEPRRDVPRPHDRARRGRRAPEDAERDRAQHPAGGADAGLPARRRDAPAVRATTRARRSRFRC